MSSVVDTIQPKDSASSTKLIFNNYFNQQISYPSNDIDAVIGFFTNNGFEKSASISIATVLLQQAKIDQINVFDLLESLKKYDKIQLSNVVTAILNSNRSKISKLGYVSIPTTKTLEARNILY